MTKLFEPIAVGSTQLGHRLAMAPLTRFRCNDDWVPNDLVKEYYDQRAIIPGTLIVTEGTLISRRAASAANVPGIWSDAQITAWKSITDSVHEKGSRIFCQLWHQGRAGKADILEPSGYSVLSSSATPLSPEAKAPIAMTEEDIAQAISDYATAAKNAVAAGFDGVEIHGANGYLLDQFLQDTCNKRTDRWGGSVENRARFHIEVTKAVIAAVGADKTGLRLSPYSDFLGMLMEEPEPTFQNLVEQLKPLGLAYLHLIEARISGNIEGACGGQKSVKWIVELWDNVSPVLLAGGFKSDTAKTAVDEVYKGYDVVIVFGRYFVANPDLVFRVKSGVSLHPYDRSLFYTPKSPRGYTDYPFSPEYLASRAS